MKELHHVSRTTLRSRRGQTTIWIIGAVVVIGIIVLLVIWSNRRVSGVRQQSEQQITTLQQQLRGAEARARLGSLKANILAEREVEDLEQQYTVIRDDLEASYAGAGRQARETWDAISADLEILGEQIRSDSAEAATTIDAVIDRIGANNQ